MEISEIIGTLKVTSSEYLSEQINIPIKLSVECLANP